MYDELAVSASGRPQGLPPNALDGLGVARGLGPGDADEGPPRDLTDPVLALFLCQNGVGDLLAGLTVPQVLPTPVELAEQSVRRPGEVGAAHGPAVGVEDLVLKLRCRQATSPDEKAHPGLSWGAAAPHTQ